MYVLGVVGYSIRYDISLDDDIGIAKLFVLKNIDDISKSSALSNT